MVTTIESATARQVPLPVELRMSVTVPATVSAALGIYVALSVVLFGTNVPVPVVLHAPPVATVTVPFRFTPDPAQIVWSGPAFTVGAGVYVIVMVSLVAMHALAAVRISITLPFAVSEALGVYVALSVESLGENVPVPLVVVQMPVPFPPVIVPPSTTTALFAQTVVSLPATVSGMDVMVITMVSVTAKQFRLLVEVSKSVTVPAVVSAALRLYVAFNVVLLGENVPLPRVLHTPVVAPPETVPFRFALMLPEQMIWLGPASTLGAGVMVITI